MMHQLTALVFALVGTAATSAHAAPPHWTAYRIEAVVSQTTADGQQQVISQPTITTFERQAAMIQVGRQSPITIEDDEVTQLETGITCRFTPYRLKAGGVKLDVEIEIVKESEDMDKTIVAEKFGIRRIQELPLGVGVEVPIAVRGRKSSHRLQLTVTELPPPIVGADDVPPPPRVGAREGRIFTGAGFNR